jgi:acyl carrier protein
MEPNTTVDDLRRKIGDIVKVDPLLLTDKSGPKSVSRWDSIAALEIISLLDDSCGGNLSAEEAASFTSFGAIVEFARKKGIVAADKQ